MYIVSFELELTSYVQISWDYPFKFAFLESTLPD
jgi:hypothetical protein